jgi:hypothetical protein
MKMEVRQGGIILRIGGWNMRWFGNKTSKDLVWKAKEAREEELEVYMDVKKAQSEWERARHYFEEAVGEEQIDYAIYMLEAAELKYQMHLKAAKRLKINSMRLPLHHSAEA